MKIRHCWAVLALLILAACQQAPGTAKPGAAPAADSGARLDNNDPSPDWSESGTHRKSKYFEAEFNDARKRMVAGLVGRCYGRSGDRGALDLCFRQGVVDAFDDSSDGKKNCESLAQIDAFTDCVILGNIAVDMARRLDPKLKVDPSIWTGRRAFADFLARIVIMESINACGDQTTELAATHCMFDHLQSKLAVPEALAKRCSSDLAAEERGACLGQAASIRYVQEHLTKLPGIGT